MAKRKKAAPRAAREKDDTHFAPCLTPDAISEPFMEGEVSFGVIEQLKVWPQNHNLTIGFWDSFPNPMLEDKVQELSAQWAKHVNLTFDFVGHNHSADVRISFSGKGHFSAVGTDSKNRQFHPQNSMNLSLRSDMPQSEFSRVILHEMGHALGLHHEHMHPEKGIPWDVQEVYRYMRSTQGWPDGQIFENVLKKLENDSRRYRWTEFDIDSIMCYYFPPNLTHNQMVFKKNTELSATDIKLIEEIYPPKPVVSKPVELTIDGKTVSDEIGKSGEVDVFFFTVETADGYVVETEGETDVTMGLYGPDDDKKLIVEDMDSGRDWNARIAKFLTPGKYHAKVWHHLSGAKGKYKISVKTWKP